MKCVLHILWPAGLPLSSMVLGSCGLNDTCMPEIYCQSENNFLLMYTTCMNILGLLLGR
jgi:hypothetical protein